ncbi:hypothetical protein IEQ34_011851 [Dendrobium chrysotoxum]|uniref:Uncharacterized protein n=1 Tax=Dendrobium chrysotoxum TaxID=161865 RepID=A0AAV7GSA8_DENCH|nr:hypothetical protein IEQ34_011851 [Dendrobium chrysotoxum]
MGKRWSSWPDCCDDLLGGHPESDVLYHDPTDHEVSATFTMCQARPKHACIKMASLDILSGENEGCFFAGK